MQNKECLLSVIVPVFNEEKNIVPLYREIKVVLESLGRDYEIIFVNDGSWDKSLEVLRELAIKDELLKVVSLSRNFGQTQSLVSGLDFACGKIIVFIDGDLQNDPKDIPLLVNKIEEGYDVVSGWRRARKDLFLTRCIPSFFANRLISLLSGIHLHDYGCTLKAYKADILKDVKLYGEMHRFIPIYASFGGAKIIEVPVNHRPRIYGKTKYNINRTFKVILDLLTIKFLANYQTKPIYIFGGSGIVAT